MSNSEPIGKFLRRVD